MNEGTGVKMNRTFTYILPMIGRAHKFKLSDLPNSFFLGIYLCHANHPDKTEHVFMHLRITHEEKFRTMEQDLRCSPYKEFEEVIGETILFCLKIPDEYKKEYHKFTQGKYYEFSNTYKQCIIKFLPSNGIEQISNVLYKTEAGYKNKEEYINKGLPKEHWTKIPRGQEIGFLLEEIIQNETFNPDKPI